jgi:hypothetical protein
VADGVAIGWAWNVNEPTARIEVAIEVEGAVVATGIADVLRDELVAEGIGDGAHGFQIALPELLQSRPFARAVALLGPRCVRAARSPGFWQTAADASPWAGVTFLNGRPGEPEVDRDLPVIVGDAPRGKVGPALAGADGWRFDGAELTAVEADPAALDRATARLCAIHAACERIGVVYVVACVPDKLQALADLALPPRGDERPWLTGVRARLRDCDGMELLDLLPVLDDARRHGSCFQRTDADWNSRGAFFAARALIHEVAKRVPGLAPPRLDQLHLTLVADYRGALADAELLAADAGQLHPEEPRPTTETAVVVDRSRLVAERVPVDRHLAGAGVHVRLLAREDRCHPTRLTLVGDEVCLPLLPWIAEGAARTSFFWSLIPPMEPIELELPAAVVHVLRYRDLATLGAEALAE